MRFTYKTPVTGLLLFIFFAGLITVFLTRETRKGDKDPQTLSSPLENLLSPGEGLKAQASVYAHKEPAQPPCEDSFKLICNFTNPEMDPTGRVGLGFKGEIRALRVLRGIVQNHPGWTSEQIAAELVQQIYTSERQAWIHGIFKNIQIAMVSYIKRQPETVFSYQEKNQIVTTLEKVQLQLPIPATNYADATDLLTKNDVFYQRNDEGEARIRVGGAYLLNTTSDFNATFTIAHELAHAIDPCEMEVAKTLPAVYQPLMQCFVDQKWLTAEKIKCGADEQVSEVFADWFAAEMVRELLESKKQYSRDERQKAAVNAVRDLCEQNLAIDKFVFTHHPPPEIRIGQVYADHPEISKALQCQKKNEVAKYCKFKHLKRPTMGESQ